MACRECGKNEEEIYLPDELCPEDVIEESIPYCKSNKGKFHDRIQKNFIVPKVGGLADMYVCEAGLWVECQWVGVCSRGKYYFFKIVSVGEKIIRVLNGCSKGDSTQPISGNPEPGTEIPENTAIFPTPPQGCSDQLSASISNSIEKYGCGAVIKCIEEAEQICFKNLSDVDDSEEINLLGVTKDVCECAPEGSILEKCLRWASRIFTGYGGKTLCLPHATETSDNDVVVDDVTISKRYAYFDEKGCIRKGKKVKDCGEASQLSPAGGETFDYLLGCKEGNRVTIPPSCEFDIASCCDKDGENESFKFVKKAARRYYLPSAICLLSREPDSTGSTVNHKFNIEQLDPSFSEFKENNACEGSEIRAILSVIIGAWAQDSTATSSIRVSFPSFPCSNNTCEGVAGYGFSASVAVAHNYDRLIASDISIPLTNNIELDMVDTTQTSGGGESSIHVQLLGYDII